VINARGVAVRRNLLRWPGDRFGASRLHAPHHKAEQLPYLAALVRAGWLVACLIALREGSDRFVDHLVLRAGENC
jgi:hypothetical protein